MSDATDNGARMLEVADDFITSEVAQRMSVVLNKAAAAVPLRQWRYHLFEDHLEWERAGQDLGYSQGEGIIVFSGSVVPGMYINHGDRGFLRVLRRVQSGAFQLDDPDDMRPVYHEVSSPISPLLVRR